MFTSQPLTSMMSRMVAPPLPMTSRIFSLGSWMLCIWGALLANAARGAARTLPMASSRSQAAGLGLVEGLGEDLGGDAADLDVHLEGGDALARCRRP